MFNRESILKSLNAENYYIDKHSLDLFLNDWKIDSIYEDESGIEFYDDLSLEKIKRGISLKSQGYTDEQIVSKLLRMEAKVDKKSTEEVVQPIFVKDYIDVPIEVEEPEQTDTVDENKNDKQENEENNEVELSLPRVEKTFTEDNVVDLTPQKSFTLDVSSQTLQMLAEAVAKKISDDITSSDLSTKLIEAGGYKRDNEILAKQVQDLLEHNKELSERIKQLESQPSRSFWNRIWGQKS